MLVPSLRLVRAAALLAVPAAALASLVPSLAPVCLWILTIFGLVALLDAVAGARRIDRLDIVTPLSLRFTKDVAASVPITIENRLPGAVRLRIAAVLPEGIESANVVRDTLAPAGRSALDWACTGRVRGDHRLSAIHLETRSPLSLWMARHRYFAECE